MKARMARSTHMSQFSMLRPVSAMSRINSGLRESSSHASARMPARNAPYAPAKVERVLKTKSAIDQSR